MGDNQCIDDIVKVHVIGTGSFGSRRSFNPSFVIEYLREYTMVDFTSNLNFALAEYRLISGEDLHIENINQGCINHIHTDHSGGTVDMAIQKFYVEMRRDEERFKLFAPKPVLDACWNHVIKGTLQKTFKETDPEYRTRNVRFEEVFNPVYLTPGKPTKIGNLKVTAKECVHAVVGGAFAYKFQCGELSIGYSGDTTPSVEVLQFLEDCDMIIHEAGGAPISGHTPVEFLVSRVPSYVARKLYLTHYPDTLSNDEDKLHCQLLRAGHCYVVRRQGVCQEKSLTAIGKQLLEIRDKI